MRIKAPLSLEKTQSLSRILSGLPFPGSSGIASLGCITSAFDRLAFNVAIFLFAALNVVPAPPGTSFFLGIPLVIIAFRKAIGLSFWLPARLLQVQVTRERYDSFRTFVLRWMVRVEKHVRPRGQWHRHPAIGRGLDWIVAILSLCILIPLPFTAILPAVSVCIITLGRLEWDGLLIKAGLLSGAMAFIICILMVYGSARLFILAFMGI